jgi:outer membrane protein TolC
MSQINENLYESIGIYVNIPLFSKGEYFKQKELTDLKKEQLQEARKKNEIDYSKRIVEIEQKTLALSAEISLETDILITLQQVFDKTKQLYLEGRVSYLDLESISMTLFEKKLIIEMLKIDKQFFQLLSL